MKVEIASYCHKGGRDEQQDAYGVFPGRDGAPQFFVVADGMGGHAGGRIASSELVGAAKRIWDAHIQNPLEPRRLLERVVEESHAAINKAGSALGMTPRSTAAILYLNGSRAHWAHVGDSRIYRFRNGQYTARTRDHSIVQMLVDLGKVSEEEMGTHPDQNRLTQSLGGDTTPNPDFGVDDVMQGDGFLLCSDGFWEMTHSREMAEALSLPALDENLAQSMVERAFERAGPRSDNITLSLVRVGGPPVRQPKATIEVGAAGRTPVSAGAPSSRWALAAALLVALGVAAYVLKPWERSDSTVPENRNNATTTPVPTDRSGPGNERKPDPAPADPPKIEGRAPPSDGANPATPQQTPDKKPDSEAAKPEAPPDNQTKDGSSPPAALPERK